MLYLVDGQPKSGSTFLFRLINQLVEPELGADDLQVSADENVFHRRPGDAGAVPFIANPDAFASLLGTEANWGAMLRERNLVLKLHHGAWLAGHEPPVSVVHFLTFRNVLDAALALLDQGAREAERPVERRRPAFLNLTDPARALGSAINQFRTIVVPALADERIIALPYPTFIEGDAMACRRIADVCKVDHDTVRSGIRALDRDVRAGLVSAQFGTGRTGRGHAERHRFPEPLVHEADQLNREFGL